MNYFKEYDDSQVTMSRWLPWACLVGEGVVANKDGSYIGVFTYTKAEKCNEGKALQKFIRSFGSGWSWWSERQVAARYIVLCWHPKRGFRLSDTERLKVEFQEVLEGCTPACGDLAELRQLKGVELLQYLHDTVSPDGTPIRRPMSLLYLDALLSQNNSYSVDSQRIQINSFYIQAIQVHGFIKEKNLNSLLAFLEQSQMRYRYVRRLLCFDEVYARKEAVRYMRGWCVDRKSILPALDYEYSSEKICGSLTNTLILWHEDVDTLAKTCDDVLKHLGLFGEIAILEKYRLADVWMGTLPGMFRCNLAFPMVELDDAATLVV